MRGHTRKDGETVRPPVHKDVTSQSPVISRHLTNFFPAFARCRARNAGSFSTPFLLESTRQRAAVAIPPGPGPASCALLYRTDSLDRREPR